MKRKIETDSETGGSKKRRLAARAAKRTELKKSGGKGGAAAAEPLADMGADFIPLNDGPEDAKADERAMKKEKKLAKLAARKERKEKKREELEAEKEKARQKKEQKEREKAAARAAKRAAEEADQQAGAASGATGSDDDDDSDVEEDYEAKEEGGGEEGGNESGKNSRFIVFVGNLPFSATADQVREHFASLKPISVRLLTQRDHPKKSRGIAFVEFGDFAHMKTCLAKFHHSEFSDGISEPRKINVELTAGGGGNKSTARKDKIKAKNLKLNEERARRMAAEEAEKKDKKKKQDGGEEGEEDKAAAAAGKAKEEEEVEDPNRGIHPSRLRQLEDGPLPSFEEEQKARPKYRPNPRMQKKKSGPQKWGGRGRR